MTPLPYPVRVRRPVRLHAVLIVSFAAGLTPVSIVRYPLSPGVPFSIPPLHLSAVPHLITLTHRQ